ncbi:Acyltransferase LovD [Vanrija pseudolonga]|uniref:Acyltransferase LovD n=1 Tax=Vanrija pseudolonga TaxID=143232 RepID=A0AAF0Y7J6_9TREE|nr:Acyltransferase LovD [Vanrija pseudolonga]
MTVETNTTTTTHAPRVADTGAAALDALLERTVANRDLPAVTFGVIGASGAPIYFAARGEKALGDAAKGQIDETTYLELYSQTKLMVAVAVLQLVDRGVLNLDDTAVVEKHAPELLAQKVLSYDDAGNEVLSPLTGKLTLRTLLTHTSGLAYGFDSPALAKWEAAHKPATSYNPESGVAGFTRPFVFQPGTNWTYSIGIDWAGIILERVTGQSLEEYFTQHIFAPLGLKDLTFYITEANAPRFQVVQTRTESGWEPAKFSYRDRTPGVRYKQLSGGGGLVGTAKDYLLFLQAILAAKEHSNAVVSKAAYDELFRDSLTADVRAKLNARPDKALKQIPGGPAALSWSVGLELNLTDGEFGRKKGSGYWGGAAKTSFWLDPASGIAAVFGTQILGAAFADLGFKAVKDEFERTLYDALE